MKVEMLSHGSNGDQKKLRISGQICFHKSLWLWDDGEDRIITVSPERTKRVHLRQLQE